MSGKSHDDETNEPNYQFCVFIKCPLGYESVPIINPLPFTSTRMDQKFLIPPPFSSFSLVVPRRQAIERAHLPAAERGGRVGRDPGGPARGPGAADQGQLDRGQQEGQRDGHLHAVVQPQEGRQHGRRPGQLQGPPQGQEDPRPPAREPRRQPPQQDQGREAPRPPAGARGPPARAAEARPGFPAGTGEFENPQKHPPSSPSPLIPFPTRFGFLKGYLLT